MWFTISGLLLLLVLAVAVLPVPRVRRRRLTATARTGKATLLAAHRLRRRFVRPEAALDWLTDTVTPLLRVIRTTVPVAGTTLDGFLSLTLAVRGAHYL